MNFVFEKLSEAGRWEEMKKYKNHDYDAVKKDVEKRLGKCSFSYTDIDSVHTSVKPFTKDSEYRIVCIGE